MAIPARRSAPDGTELGLQTASLTLPGVLDPAVSPRRDGRCAAPCRSCRSAWPHRGRRGGSAPCGRGRGTRRRRPARRPLSTWIRRRNVQRLIRCGARWNASGCGGMTGSGRAMTAVTSPRSVRAERVSGRLWRRSLAPPSAPRQGTKGTRLPAVQATDGRRVRASEEASRSAARRLDGRGPPHRPADGPCRWAQRGCPRALDLAAARAGTIREPGHLPVLPGRCERRHRPADRGARRGQPLRRPRRGRAPVAAPAAARLPDQRPCQLPALPARRGGHDRRSRWRDRARSPC